MKLMMPHHKRKSFNYVDYLLRLINNLTKLNKYHPILPLTRTFSNFVRVNFIFEQGNTLHMHEYMKENLIEMRGF